MKIKDYFKKLLICVFWAVFVYCLFKVTFFVVVTLYLTWTLATIQVPEMAGDVIKMLQNVVIYTGIVACGLVLLKYNSWRKKKQ